MAPEITTGAGCLIRVSPNPVRQTLKMHALQKLHLWLCLRHDVSISITKIWFFCLFYVIIGFFLSLMDMALQVNVHAVLLCNKQNFFKALCVCFCFFFLNRNNVTVAVIGDYGRVSVYFPYAPLISENISGKPPRMLSCINPLAAYPHSNWSAN